MLKLSNLKCLETNAVFFSKATINVLLKKNSALIPFLSKDNHSFSPKNVLRGLHYQIRNPQGKLVRIVNGEVFDVAVDIRKESKTFGKWVGVHLSAQNKRMLWIPEGFAHGFLVLSETCDFLYKTTAFYDAVADRCIRWDDPELAITWPIRGAPVLSEKDQNGKWFRDAEVFE